MSKPNEIISLISQVREGANKIIVDELRKSGIEDLAPSHGNILVHLYRNDDLCMKDLAERINKDKSTITALVNKLVKLGYIRKVKDKEDNRITRIQLTEKSLEVQDIFFKISEDLMKKIYQGFSESDKDSLKSLLYKMKSNL